MVFTIPPYSQELNQIEETFGILIVRILKETLTSKSSKKS